jgi:hypothetical protein
MVITKIQIIRYPLECFEIEKILISYTLVVAINVPIVIAGISIEFIIEG